MKSRHCNKAWQSCNLIPLTQQHSHIFLPWLIFDNTVQSVLLFYQLITHSSHLLPGQSDTTPFQYLKCPLASAMQYVAWRLCISILSWSCLNCNLSTIFHSLFIVVAAGVTDALRPHNKKPFERIRSCSSNISRRVVLHWYFFVVKYNSDIDNIFYLWLLKYCFVVFFCLSLTLITTSKTYQHFQLKL